MSDPTTQHDAVQPLRLLIIEVVGDLGKSVPKSRCAPRTKTFGVEGRQPFNGVSTMVDENGPHYFVVFHSPGPNWVAGTPYNEQPEFMDHVNYISSCHDKGKIVLSGPFMETPGGLAGKLASGGMAIFKAADLQEATRLGTDDPTVRSGMLNVEIKTLWVPFHD